MKCFLESLSTLTNFLLDKAVRIALRPTLLEVLKDSTSDYSICIHDHAPENIREHFI